MSFKPALIIPIYNHKDTIAATVSRLTPFGLPIFIIDDGSNSATQEVLATLASSEPLIRLSRLAQNSGKGAAVMAGFRTAYAAGFTHALQIDADGQHETADVSRFLERGAARPDAIIAGKPIYDDSVPKARLYGRYLTHFWVWVETLSFAVGDSMCGFRLYPLAATVALIDRVAIPTRMDFDIEIIVRLMWDGVPVENIATRVTYPEGGLSHFDMLHDNLRISWMHTRLTTAMLLRLPLILWRKKFPRPIQDAKHWSRQEERGSRLGMYILVTAYRLFGGKLAKLMLRPIVAWHVCFGHEARRQSLNYLTRLHQYSGGKTPAPTFANAYRHMLAFARSALDKLGAWINRIDDTATDFPNQKTLDDLLASGRGAILIGAHLGNLEMMRALAVNSNLVTVNAVIFAEHAPRFIGTLGSASDRFKFNLIHVPSFGPETAIALAEKIDRGELLVITGDRTPPAENGRVVSARFLDAPAEFPQGPYVLANLLDCPVYLFFSIEENNRYQVFLEPFAERIELPRGGREAAMAAYAQRYARRLEELCLRAPLQWFNFFDFWQHKNPTAEAAKPAQFARRNA